VNIMNNPIQPSKTVVPYLRLVSSNDPKRDAPRARVVRDEDPFTRCYRRFTRQLRAACSQYVDSEDVNDLVQDVWTVAAQRSAKLAESDARTLSWLIGIAKRCAPSYESLNARMVPLEELLGREAGDDLEGRGLFEDVEEMRASRWGDGG
jgi:DNA-directed RNA polymerase specialized sigma24 family protein